MRGKLIKQPLFKCIHQCRNWVCIILRFIIYIHNYSHLHFDTQINMLVYVCERAGETLETKKKRKEEIFSVTGVGKDGIEYVFLIDV